MSPVISRGARVVSASQVALRCIIVTRIAQGNGKHERRRNDDVDLD